jgi:asparagine synthase (glutamine-hydrolysing)
MCGIVGIVSRNGAQPDAARRAGALASLSHRGPDGEGQYGDRGVWLGHRRLSVIDLSAAGAQPMATPCGGLVISYNGEVYNFRDLAAALSIEGLRSRSDTEVVLRAVERIGVDAFARLNGMFAFAAYDRERQRLWLVRDRLGIKPLYYRLTGDRLVFASEIKAIYALTGETAACDVAAIHEWLYYENTLADRTLHAGVRQLLPGHYLLLDISTFTTETRRYWALTDVAEPPRRIVGDVIAETRRLLDQAVRRQLVSDVPVGVFLSGGVDSSAIAAFASRHYGGRLATYSAGFDDRSGVDERPKARRLATLYGTDHHEVEIGGGGVAEMVERMVRHHDQPFADAANIPLYRLASAISGRIKVVLQGDGGDELFGGYRRYVTLRYHRWLRALARWGRHLPRLAPTSPLQYRVQRYLRAYAAPDLASTMARLLTVEDPDEPPTAAFGDGIRPLIERADPFVRYRECQQLVADRDIGSQMSLVDLMVELPDVYLEKVDRATMATGLEVRVPFLDHDLVEMVAALPGSVKMPRGRRKWLLKQALAGVVPADVLRGPKIGFSVPYGYWLRTSLAAFFFDHLATFERAQPGVLNRQVLERWHRDTQSRRRDHASALWKMLNFMVWCNVSGVRVGALPAWNVD